MKGHSTKQEHEAMHTAHSSQDCTGCKEYRLLMIILKLTSWGVLWHSSGQDSTLPLQGGPGSIPTKIPQATHHGQKFKKKSSKQKNPSSLDPVLLPCSQPTGLDSPVFECGALFCTEWSKFWAGPCGMTSQTSKGEVAKTGRCENAGFSKNDGSSHVSGPCRWPEGMQGGTSLKR